MFTIYVYVLDSLADWELGNVLPELNSGRFFKEGQQGLVIKKVSNSNDPIITMGRLTIVPDCTIDEIVMSDNSILLLPGANTWSDPKHGAIIEKASELLSLGATVCAICGATAALAEFGLLDNRFHTSNGPGFLEMLAKNLKCQAIPLNKISAVDMREYEQLVYGGWVRASEIVGLNKFIKKLPDGKNQKLVIFAVGADGASNETDRKLIEKNNVVSQLNYPFFYLQGGFDPEKLKFPMRLMLEGVAKSLKKKEETNHDSLTQDDRDFLAFFQDRHNDVDEHNLVEILACLQDTKTGDKKED